MLLTNEELWDLQTYKEPANSSVGYEKNIAKAQHQKDIDWLEKHTYYRTVEIGKGKNKRICNCLCFTPECWKEFKTL